jgi:hypothetical protein
MSENEPTYDREVAIKELLFRVQYSDPIEEILTNKLQTLSLSEQQKNAVDAITSSTQKGDTVGSLTAQSDLTAVRLLQMQLEMKLNERSMDKSYVEAETKVKDILGSQLEDIKELGVITTEIHQRDPGTRW